MPLEAQEAHALAVMKEWIEVAEGRSYDHISQTFRWLMGTLFAANGGAVLAMINNGDIGGTSREAPLILFGVGLVLSIGVGIATTWVGYRQLLKLAQIRGDVVTMLISGQKNDTVVQRLNAMKPTWKTFTPSYVAIGSLVCFVAGSLAVGASLL